MKREHKKERGERGTTTCKYAVAAPAGRYATGIQVKTIPNPLFVVYVYCM